MCYWRFRREDIIYFLLLIYIYIVYICCSRLHVRIGLGFQVWSCLEVFGKIPIWTKFWTIIQIERCIDRPPLNSHLIKIKLIGKKFRKSWSVSHLKSWKCLNIWVSILRVQAVPGRSGRSYVIHSSIHIFIFYPNLDFDNFILWSLYDLFSNS